jgi:hypothetical protein
MQKMSLITKDREHIKTHIRKDPPKEVSLDPFYILSFVSCMNAIYDS